MGKFKKISAVLCAAAAVAAAGMLTDIPDKIIPDIVSLEVSAEETASGTCGTSLTWSLEGNTLVISGTGAMSNYSSGNAPWYAYREDITSLIINDGVTSIGDSAFYNCTELNNVTWSSTLTTIGYSAFENTAITKLPMPDTVTAVNVDAFRGCQSLSEVHLSKKLVTLEYGAFYDCDSLKSIEIPASLTTATYYYGSSSNYRGIFSQCDNLKNITFENGIEKIVSNLFYNCDSIETIVIPDTVEQIGSRAFWDCNGLTYLKIPSSVATIGDYAFSGCTKLTHIHIPEGAAYDVYAGIADLPADASCYFPGGCGNYDCPVYNMPVYDPSSPDYENDYQDKINIKKNGYDFNAEINADDVNIIYDTTTETYNNTYYDLTFRISQNKKNSRTLNGLSIVLGVSRGFSFSQTPNDTKIVYDDWVFYPSEMPIPEGRSVDLKIYPDLSASGFDPSNGGSVTVTARIYNGDELVGTADNTIQIRATKSTPAVKDDTGPDNSDYIRIDALNEDEYKDKDGNMTLKNGEFAIDTIFCNDLTIKNADVTIVGNVNVAGDLDVECKRADGHEFRVNGDLDVAGDMTLENVVFYMTYSKAVVDVHGDLYVSLINNGSEETLTNGVLNIGGSFGRRLYDFLPTYFSASGNHVTHFYSSSPFRISSVSLFNDLTFTSSAKDNFRGDIYTNEVKGHFLLNDSQYPHATKGENLKTLFADYEQSISQKAGNAIIDMYDSIYSGTNSTFKSSLELQLSDQLSKNTINEIAASTELYFQLEAMNGSNSKDISIEGIITSLNGFNSFITFDNVPLKKGGKADLVVYLKAMGGGVGSSSATMCTASWMLVNKNTKVKGTALMTYSNTSSLYKDLYDIYKENAHEGDYWYWFVQVVNDLLDGEEELSGVSEVKNIKTVVNIIDKCVRSAKQGNPDPLIENIQEGDKAIKCFEKMNDLAEGKTKWTAALFCPVDVEIRDAEGNVVGLIKDNKVVTSTSEVNMSVVNDIKIISLTEKDKYSITVTSTGNGTVDYIIDETADGSAVRRLSFDAIPITEGTVLTGTIDVSEDLPAENYYLKDSENNYYFATNDELDLSGDDLPPLPGEKEYHTVYIPENVTVTLNGQTLEDKACAEPGDVLTITAAQLEGYFAPYITVNGVEFTNGGTFTVGNENVEISVRYAEIIKDDETLLGDLDGSGKLDQSDIEMMRDMIAAGEEDNDGICDMNGDEYFDIRDLSALIYTVENAAAENTTV